jgi:hypothetical protein
MAKNETNIGDGPYTIEARRIPIGATGDFAGHLYIVFKNAEGAFAYIDGLAVDPKTGQIPKAGSFKDNIKVRADKNPIWHEADKHESIVLYQTNSTEEINKALQATLEQGNVINYSNEAYGLINSNSNTVFAKLLENVSKVVPISKDVVEKAKRLGGLNPGVDGELISRDNLPWWAKIAETGTFLWEEVTGAFNSVVAWAGDTFLPKSNKEKIAKANQALDEQNNLQPVSNQTTEAYKAGQPLYGYIPPETPYFKTSQGQKIG